MISKQWTANDIIKLLRMTDSSRTPLYYAEEQGHIPMAQRVVRGKIKVRKWDTSDIPVIGKKFGFLSPPQKQLIITTYTPKGGVTKTTFTANLARILAIHGIKTLACGLDFQRSLTRYLIHSESLKNLDDIGKNPTLGLHHLIFDKAPIDQVIKKTDLPTLDVIPETSDLNFMAKKMRVENRREYIFKERLLPLLGQYEVILFDCNPGWSDLSENALVAANNIVMAAACETECYEALKTNLSEISDFQKSMRIIWENFLMFPTLLENNSTSQNIYARYLNMYEDTIIPSPIRRSIIAQEARMANMSIFEYNPTSSLALDYYNLIKTLWGKLNNFKELEEGVEYNES
jgi:chromosome partitioning protein